MQVFLLARIIDYQSLQKYTLTEIFNIDDFFYREDDNLICFKFKSFF